MVEHGPHEWSPHGGPPGTLGRFIYENKITLDYDPISERPDRQYIMDANEQEWNDRAYHYKVTLKRGPKRHTTFWSQGSAVTKPPEADDVLDNLASEASSFDNSGTFEQWADEYGYDTDSRTAERIYKAVAAASAKLKKFLGEELYKKLLFDTERL